VMLGYNLTCFCRKNAFACAFLLWAIVCTMGSMLNACGGSSDSRNEDTLGVDGSISKADSEVGQNIPGGDAGPWTDGSGSRDGSRHEGTEPVAGKPCVTADECGGGDWKCATGFTRTGICLRACTTNSSQAVEQQTCGAGGTCVQPAETTKPDQGE